jgi:hypothetical protein
MLKPYPSFLVLCDQVISSFGVSGGVIGQGGRSRPTDCGGILCREIGLSSFIGLTGSFSSSGTKSSRLCRRYLNDFGLFSSYGTSASTYLAFGRTGDYTFIPLELQPFAYSVTFVIPLTAA